MDKQNTVKIRRNNSFSRTLREKGSPDIRRRSIHAMTTMPMDRESMLIMEANEISQYLKKHYRFNRTPEGVVKVVNTMLGLSCLWTLDRLRERLVNMRKLMYSADTDKSAMAGESVFFDPTDTWTKEQDDINIHILESPRMKKQEGASSKPSSNGSSRTVTRSDASLTSRRSETTTPVTSSRPSSRASDRSDTPSSNSRPMCEVYPTVKSKHKNENNEINDVTVDCSGQTEPPSVSPRANHQESNHRSVPKPTKSQSPTPSCHSAASSCSTSAAATPSAKSLSTSLSASMRKSAGSMSQEESSHQEVEVVNAACQTDRQLRSSPVVSLSLDMIKLLRDRLRTGDPEGNVLIDQILCNCESLKIVVVNILEGFSQVQDSGDEVARFNDSDLMKTSSMQLVSALELLVSNTRHLLARHDVTDNEVTSSIHDKICSTRNDLATELIILLHECQNSSESGVEESSSRVLELVYDVANHCGYYYMTLGEGCPNSLKDTQESTIQDLVVMRSNGDHDILNKFADTDIKQSFVSGADAALRMMLDDSQGSIHKCEKNLLVLAETSSKTIEEIVIQGHRVEGASRRLVKLLQQIQSQASKRLLEDVPRSKNYYCYHYSRDLQIGSKVNTLVSGLTMLSQATSSLVQAEDQGNFRRVHRCVEIVQNAIKSLLQVSKHDIPFGEGADSKNVKLDDSNLSCVLSTEEAEKLQNASDDVTKATEAMTGRVKQHIVDDGTACKSRRMLPAPPSGKGVVRCNSARSATDKTKFTRQRSITAIRNNEI